MKSISIQTFWKSVIIGAGLLVGGVVAAQTWTPPGTAAPPAGNVTVSGSQWTTNGSNIYYNSGNVGVGISPTQKLHVQGPTGSPASSGTAQTALMRFTNPSNNLALDIGQQTASPWTSWIQATDKNNLANTYPLTLNPIAGPVGIGTMNPLYKLDMWGGDQRIRSTAPTIVFQDADHRSAMVRVNSNIFYVLRGSGVDSNTWTQTGGNWPLQINLENNDVTIGSINLIMGDGTWRAVRTHATNYAQNARRLNGYIEWQTDAGAVGTNYFNSDARLKHDIAPAEDTALDKLTAIPFKAFNYNEGSGYDPEVRYQVGYLAQDLQKINPLWVNTLQPGTEGERLIPDPTTLIPYTMKAVQELNEKIEAQQAQIDALTAELRKLQKR